jgi:hypothetical protein
MEMQREFLLRAGFAKVEVIWEEGEAAIYVQKRHQPDPGVVSRCKSHGG